MASLMTCLHESRMWELSQRRRPETTAGYRAARQAGNFATLQPEGIMDGLTAAELKGVVAPLNFLEPMAEKPVSYNYDPPPGVPPRTGRNETHTVTVHDARAIGDRLSLNAEGFVLLRRPSAVKNFYDEAEITRVYYPE